MPRRTKPTAAMNHFRCPDCDLDHWTTAYAAGHDCPKRQHLPPARRSVWFKLVAPAQQPIPAH